MFLNAEPQSTGTPSPAERRRADRLVHLFDGRLPLEHELLHQVLVVLGELLEQLVARGLGLGPVLLGDVGVLPLLAHVALPVVGVHLHEVDHPVEVGLRAPGQLQHERVRGEPVDHHVDRALEVGAGAVHLVHEAMRGTA